MLAYYINAPHRSVIKPTKPIVSIFVMSIGQEFFIDKFGNPEFVRDGDIFKFVHNYLLSVNGINFAVQITAYFASPISFFMCYCLFKKGTIWFRREY